MPAAPAGGADSASRDALPAFPLQDAATDVSIGFSDLSLHDLFEQQTRSLLEIADLDEEQKQAILVGMNCPCCGGGGMSFSFRLKK